MKNEKTLAQIRLIKYCRMTSEERMLIECLTNLDVYITNKNDSLSETIFFKQGDLIMFIFDKRINVFSCNRMIWDTLVRLNVDDTQKFNLIKKTAERYLSKENILISGVEPIQYMFLKMVEDHLMKR